jgi:hypothetical protein
MRYFLLILCCLVSFGATAQLYKRPAYDYNRTQQNLRLKSIQCTKKSTVVEMTYTHLKMDEGSITYIYIVPTMCIEDIKTGKKYFVTRTENIPMEPGKHELKRVGETVNFKVFFPPINPSKIRRLNIIEDEPRGFKFYNVCLFPVA